MKLWGKLRQGWKRAWRRLNLRFFWQMALAFGLVTLLPLGAVYLVGRQALRQTQAIIGNSPLPGHTLWADRLSRYYQEHGSWDGVETMIAGYPTGPGWEPYDADWQRPYILLSPTGEVIASDNPEQQGENLGQVEQGLAMPIRVNGQLVGRILLSDFRAIAPPPDQPTPLPRVGRIAERMLGSSVYVMVAAVIVGLVLSRGISRPVQEVTDAARAIASGTLSARVSQDHVGEMGELAATFNAMADALAGTNPPAHAIGGRFAPPGAGRSRPAAFGTASHRRRRPVARRLRQFYPPGRRSRRHTDVGSSGQAAQSSG